MKSFLRGAFLTSIALLSLLSIKGCIFSPEKEKPKPVGTEYVPSTSPENLVTNLEVAYRRQEIAKYAELLAPEFRFEFQSVDASEIGLDSWNRDQDSTGTDALFRTPLVSDIRIDLTHQPAEEPTEIGFDPGTLKIRINPTFLEVDQTDGITWQVDGDLQDMFFRKGREAAGEDTTRWFLFEWRDIPSGGGTLATRGGAETLSDGGGTTRTVSWGQMLHAMMKSEQ